MQRLSSFYSKNALLRRATPNKVVEQTPVAFARASLRLLARLTASDRHRPGPCLAAEWRQNKQQPGIDFWNYFQRKERRDTLQTPLGCVRGPLGKFL